MRFAKLSDVVRQIFQHAGSINVPQQRRRLAHKNSARPECLDDKSKLRKFFRARRNRFRFARIEFNNFRNEQTLPAHAAIRQHLLHALIDKPLVRRMLIDNDNAILSLRDDIRLMNLRPRRTKRKETRILWIVVRRSLDRGFEIGWRNRQQQSSARFLQRARSAS